jgi:two-component system chemotaxis response regulator CheB
MTVYEMSVETRLCDVVALVGSAGGIAAMGRVLAALPADLDAAVVVVLHLTPHHPSLLARVLARSTPLLVQEAHDGAVLEPGVVYVAPPDAHLLVTAAGTLRLEVSELVHFVRPSADALLFSIARDYAGRRLAVVMSGSGVDGAAGAAALRQAGGRVIAQDAATAEHFGMPGAAIQAGGVDEVLSLDDIGPAVLEFAQAA